MPEIDQIDDEELLQDIDETLVERVIGLTEMFPESVRNASSATAGAVTGGAKWLYKFTGKALWIASTSFMVLVLPVVFEVERIQTEEAQLQQQRQILLGPSATTPGVGGMGAVPPGYPAAQRK